MRIKTKFQKRDIGKKFIITTKSNRFNVNILQEVTPRSIISDSVLLTGDFSGSVPNIFTKIDKVAQKSPYSTGWRKRILNDKLRKIGREILNGSSTLCKDSSYFFPESQYKHLIKEVFKKYGIEL
jgi:hypothetical protein